jgi:Phage gp6-like head-tail connector protein
MSLKEIIARMAEVDVVKHSDYLDDYIPILLEFAEDHCNNTFDAENPPGGVKIFLSESIKYKLNSKGLSSRSMGSVSYTYDTNLPDKIMKYLRPYRKVRFV